MKTSHPAKPVLDIIGKRDLELGPFADGVAEASPWANWRLRTDADGIAWLLFDKKDASANTLSADVLVELNAILEKLEREQDSAALAKQIGDAVAELTERMNGYAARQKPVDCH